jgi:hypothetical protein
VAEWMVTSCLAGRIWAWLAIPANSHIIEEQRRIAEEHIKEIWAEQEALNAARPPVRGSRLSLASRYAGGRPRRAP